MDIVNSGERRQMADHWMFVGTYTQGTDAEGIYRLRLDAATGVLVFDGLAAEAPNPAFLTADPSFRHLFVSEELFEGEGSVSAWSLDAESGALAFCNRRPSGGRLPCHIAMGDGAVFVSNYGTGSVVTFPVDADGSIGEVSSQTRHEGSGPNAQRQEGPHAHSVRLAQDGDTAFAPDLGADRLFAYVTGGNRLVQAPDLDLAVTPGSGPRHMLFSPDGRRAYIIMELSNEIVACDFQDGRLRQIQAIPTLPDDFTGVSTTADIHMSRDGRYLYGSNRGHDSIAGFAVDPDSGKLNPIGHTPTGGGHPRNFTIHGDFLFVANRDGGNIVPFRIDGSTGELVRTGEEVAVPAPVCLLTVPMA